ncbi:MAG: HPr(Ser) kinase/phosphatase [Methylotenera sp.]|uniref:HPr(Ser) kinase/phosphatase n=1 Tax=Methylotenera sp. TaxID=2051956 RepID=UPI002720E80D|nr:HPr(Ser) kinase/phosphatase [Methylotenera sp.]MDO9204206.1 HPr(Ser) kinase/phosphatase [Methylotenera sp.]MDO9393605.1 HPr(Ser) kinase/phosphatase [Methylotenera sp.]MDP1523875.1 HPr(Ser) kinase/phosphatase [Methylotenera sp.]MDP3308139.1 HPr(Ser) kinase/phosphatase [Methylotenera sp.]MDP3817702.1 HPr(Ser) kinase/phosphatase [Methylotenera sp.]
MAQINVAELFKQTRRKLKLNWIAGLDGGFNSLTSETVSKPSLALIGHLNFVHPNRVQVLGCAEMDYLQSLQTAEANSAIKNLYSTDLAAVIVANGEKVPETLIAAANSHNTPLFSSPLRSPELMDILNHFLAQAVAESVSMHGVFMEVQGFGALIKGEAGMGKSELALELISRGHRLIADDIVDFFRISPERIEGRCPPLLQDFIEVRGLGILNIRALFGDNSVKPTKPLDLIIQLEMADKLAPHLLDRLKIKTLNELVLGVKIPKVQIPIAAGRNIAVLVEVAIRNHMLLLRGVNATKQFTQRQQREMKKSANTE